MKFSLPTSELNYLVNRVLSAISQKPTMLILGNILIEAFNDELVITATDLTLSIRCFTDAKILEEGATTLSKKFSQLIRELTVANIEVFTNSQEITTISAGSSRFKLNGMSRAEFPALPDISHAYAFKMKQKDLKELLYRTAFAVSKEEDRYVLTGINLQISNGTITAIGTDGKRLARVNFPVEVDPLFTSQSVLPIKAVEEIIRCLSEDEADVTLHIMSDKIAIETRDTQIIAKLLQGDYPDLNRVIPQHYHIQIAVHREEFITLLRQIVLFLPDATQKAPQKAVRFILTDGELALRAMSADVGEGEVSMAVNYNGDRFEAGFNATAILETLRHCKEETVTMKLVDPYNPATFTEGSALFVHMPMRSGEA
jgi:DNA polymerase III subunit beta